VRSLAEEQLKIGSGKNEKQIVGWDRRKLSKKEETLNN